MIGSSRRSSHPHPDPGANFSLHLREARSATLHRRLLHASIAALVAAVVLLFVPLQLPVRALVALAAGVGGAAWPLRRGVNAALGAIRRQTGLSYETALALLGARRGASATDGTARSGAENHDPYGLEEAVIARAQEAVKSYEPEQRPAWWLPALVLAASLVAIPELLPTVLPGATPPGAVAPGAGSEPPPAAEPTPDPAAPEPPAPGRAEPPGATPNRDDEDDESAPVTELPEGDVEGQAPLARYLESLRERPAAAGAPTDGADTPTEQEGAEQARDDQPREPGDTRDPSSSERTDRESDANGSSGAPPTESGEDSAEGEETAEEGGDTEGEGEQAAGVGDEEGGSEPGGEQFDEGEPGAGSDESGNEAALSQGGSGDPAGAGEGAESAGVGGAEGQEELLDPSGAGGAQELLTGVLQDGPESVAGSVRLPGSDDVELPAGTSMAPYRSAAEEALTETDLPLDYQEIIRRYFQ